MQETPLPHVRVAVTVGFQVAPKLLLQSSPRGRVDLRRVLKSMVRNNVANFIAQQQTEPPCPFTTTQPSPSSFSVIFTTLLTVSVPLLFSSSPVSVSPVSLPPLPILLLCCGPCCFVQSRSSDRNSYNFVCNEFVSRDRFNSILLIFRVGIVLKLDLIYISRRDRF